MEKEELTLVELVDGIAANTNILFEEMAEEGHKIMENFRTNPANKDAIKEAFLNMTNPDYKVSKYGNEGGFFLFMNSTLSLFVSVRENLYPNLPKGEDTIMWREITHFYIKYLFASLNCLDTRLTTMSDVSKATAELRDHFINVFLVKYVKYVKYLS